MITREQIIDKLLTICDKEIRRFNFSNIFSKQKSIKLTPTVILEPWAKDANLPLPEKICFPDETCDFKLNRDGVSICGKLIEWADIKFTAIAVHHIVYGRNNSYDEHYFMALTITNEVINHKIGDLSKYYNLTGHFIELYKSEYLRKMARH